jgi:hypothetical protein
MKTGRVFAHPDSRDKRVEAGGLFRCALAASLRKRFRCHRLLNNAPHVSSRRISGKLPAEGRCMFRSLMACVLICLVGCSRATNAELQELGRLERERNKIVQLLSAANANKAELQSLLEDSDPKNPRSAKATEEITHLLNGVEQTSSELESQLSEVDAKIKSQKLSTGEAEPTSPPR